mgnify:CR=1 FL=1
MFRTTIWSDLEDAAAGHASAVEGFVARYRPPVVRYLRQQGVDAQAEDLAQEVFLRLFAQSALERGLAAQGRFRSFLLGLTHNVLLEHWRAQRALKRGGAARHVSFDLAQHDLSAHPGPSEEETFVRCWQEHALRLALERVGEEHPRQGELLRRTARGETPAQIADELGRPAGQVRVDLHRARKRLAQRVREEIARFASDRAEYEHEVAAFLARLPGGS